MKKGVLFACASALALSSLYMTSCHGNMNVGTASSEDSDSVAILDIKDCDLAFLSSGKLFFTHIDQGDSILLSTEKDSAVNLIFGSDSLCYYTVVRGNDLMLRQININTTESTDCAAWPLDRKLWKTEYGYAIYDLQYDKKTHTIINEYHMNMESYMCDSVILYHIESGKFDKMGKFDYIEKTIDDEEDPRLRTLKQDYNTINNQLVRGELDENGTWIPKNNVSGKIDMKKAWMYEEDELDDEFQYEVIHFSKDEKYVVYAALISWGDFGHGPICVASVDGKEQMALPETDASNSIYRFGKNDVMFYTTAEVDDDGKEALFKFQIGKDKKPVKLAKVNRFAVR